MGGEISESYKGCIVSREFKNNNKINQKSAFYPPHMLGILNSVSDKIILPMEAVCFYHCPSPSLVWHHLAQNKTDTNPWPLKGFILVEERRYGCVNT